MDLFQEIDFTMSDQQLKVVIPVMTGLIGFMIYWFTQESPALKRRLESKFGEEKASIRRIISTKYLGAVSLGILPFLVYKIAFPDTSLAQLGFTINKSTILTSLMIGLGLGGVMALTLYFNTRKPRIQDKHPEIRVKVWERSLIFNNLLAWAVYLLGYEFFFRGVLLFPLFESIGLWPAIAVNALFYAGVHIPKGVDEAILALPFAVILCLLTVTTGTIWIAFLVHLMMAWTVTMGGIRHNPKLTFYNSSSK